MAADRTALVECAAKVAEHSFFAFVEPAPTADDVVLHRDWYYAVVIFRGPVFGAVVVAMPATLARELSASFLGEEDANAFDDIQVQDMVGEFANMTTGLWVTGLTQAVCFELGRPDVIRLETSPDVPLALLVNGQPLMIGFEFHDESRA